MIQRARRVAAKSPKGDNRIEVEPSGDSTDDRSVPEPRWGLFGRVITRDRFEPEKTYLFRLRIIETPFFSVFAHRIDRPDADTHLHNHPWGFWSLILSGGYQEVFAPDVAAAVRHAAGESVATRRTWKRWSLHRIRHGDYHAICKLDKSPTWSLLAVGPLRTGWGFATEAGFMSYDTYEKDWLGKRDDQSVGVD